MNDRWNKWITFRTAHSPPPLRDTPHPFPCCLGHGHPRLPLEGTWGFPARGATRELGRRGTGYGQRAAAGIPQVADSTHHRLPSADNCTQKVHQPKRYRPRHLVMLSERDSGMPRAGLCGTQAHAPLPGCGGSPGRHLTGFCAA